jgi:hypothetical protein
MADPTDDHRVLRAFTVLLDELATLWPKTDIDYVREEVGYDEYEDGLENLIALGLRNGRGFSADQINQVEALAAAMGIQGSLWLAQLRAASAANRNGQ